MTWSVRIEGREIDDIVKEHPTISSVLAIPDDASLLEAIKAVEIWLLNEWIEVCLEVGRVWLPPRDADAPHEIEVHYTLNGERRALSMAECGLCGIVARKSELHPVKDEAARLPTRADGFVHVCKGCQALVQPNV